MKKLFTLAAAMLTTVSLFAALPLNSLSKGTTTFTSEFWGTTVDKNKVIYDQGNYFMMYTQGNALTFNETLGMLVGNSSKVSAFEFRTSEATDMTINVGYNNSNATITLYYMGADTPDELTSSNLATAGSKKWDEVAVTSTETTGALTAKNAPAGYYKVVSTLRFAVKDIVLASATPADHTKATVNSISIDGEKIADFDPAQLTYGKEYPYGTTEAPTVTAEAGDDATIVVTQATGIPGAATVKCTSYDETASVTYTINFTAAATPSTDATLKSLSVGGKALADFAPDQYEYSVELEFDATEAPAVVGEKNEDHANVQVNAAAAVPGATTVVVTAQDGTTTLTYTVNFTIETVIPIIRANHVKGKEAIVKGSIGGTSEKNTQDDGKFGSPGHYWGLTLAGENTFKEGDILHVVISTLGQQGTIAVYADNAGSTLLYDTEALGVLGDNQFTLPAAVDGKSSIYIVRTDDNKWNAYVSSISVVRPGTATGIDNTEMNVKAVKTFENGQLVIIKNGVKYNAQGAIVK